MMNDQVGHFLSYIHNLSIFNCCLLVDVTALNVVVSENKIFKVFTIKPM